jgi:6,7-dimethyl-8-ribityllumazine synthase
MQHANKGADVALDGKGLRIGIVQARFNEDITHALAEACLGELAELGVADADITIGVPGALKCRLRQALATQALSGADRAGSIIRGDLPLRAGGKRIGREREPHRADYHPVTNATTTENFEQTSRGRPTGLRGARRSRNARLLVIFRGRRHPKPAASRDSPARASPARAPSASRPAAAQSRCGRLPAPGGTQRRLDHRSHSWPASTRPTPPLDALLHGRSRRGDSISSSSRCSTASSEISSVEHAVMWIGVCNSEPRRALARGAEQCIELAKEFGGTDDHKYVNAAQRPAQLRRSRSIASGKARPENFEAR